jgi:hypothetical protein
MSFDPVTASRLELMKWLSSKEVELPKAMKPRDHYADMVLKHMASEAEEEEEEKHEDEPMPAAKKKATKRKPASTPKVSVKKAKKAAPKTPVSSTKKSKVTPKQERENQGERAPSPFSPSRKATPAPSSKATPPGGSYLRQDPALVSPRHSFEDNPATYGSAKKRSVKKQPASSSKKPASKSSRVDAPLWTPRSWPARWTTTMTRRRMMSMSSPRSKTSSSAHLPHPIAKRADLLAARADLLATRANLLSSAEPSLPARLSSALRVQSRWVAVSSVSSK